MAEPILSPDGKWMWTGSEWIPAPPSSSQSANVNLQDSVVGGDVHITQNNADDIAVAMVKALERLGFSGQSSPTEITPSQEKEVEQVLELSEQLIGHGVEIEPWTETNLGKSAELLGKNKTAQQHYMRALEIYRKNNEEDGESRALNLLGNLALKLGDLIEAERNQREALRIVTKIDHKDGMSSALNNLAMIARERKDLDEAQRLFKQSLDIAKEYLGPTDIAIKLNNVGDIFRMQRNFSEAEDYFRESLELFSMSESDNYRFIGIVKNNLAIVREKQGGRDEAIKLYQESLAVKKDIGDLEGQANVLNNLAILANSENKLAEAERLYQESLANYRDSGYRAGEAKVLENLGNLYNKKGQPDEARRYYTESVRIVREIGIPVKQWYIDNGY